MTFAYTGHLFYTNISPICRPAPLAEWDEQDVRQLLRSGSAYVVTYTMTATRDDLFVNGHRHASIPRAMMERLKAEGTLTPDFSVGTGYGVVLRYLPTLPV